MSKRDQMTAEEWEAHWNGEIEVAQSIKHVRVGRKVLKRIAWGSEPPPNIDNADYIAEWHRTAGSQCHDCAAEWGQLHVPHCDMEHCPHCGGQLISCDCGGNLMSKRGKAENYEHLLENI